MKIDLVKFREQANLKVRKDTITDIINQKRGSNPSKYISDNLLINLHELKLPSEMLTIYNNLNEVKWK